MVPFKSRSQPSYTDKWHHLHHIDRRSAIETGRDGVSSSRLSIRVFSFTVFFLLAPGVPKYATRGLPPGYHFLDGLIRLSAMILSTVRPPILLVYCCIVRVMLCMKNKLTSTKLGNHTPKKMVYICGIDLSRHLEGIGCHVDAL